MTLPKCLYLYNWAKKFNAKELNSLCLGHKSKRFELFKQKSHLIIKQVKSLPLGAVIINSGVYDLRDKIQKKQEII